MVTKEQSERSEEALRTVFKNQYLTLTNQVLNNLNELSKIGEKWSTKLLLIVGALLLLASLPIKLLFRIEYPGGFSLPYLTDMEFTTLILAATALLLVGALSSLFQAWGWRRIIQAQQAVGVEILNKQLDIEKDLLIGKNRHQPGELILFPAKIRRRHHR